MTKSVRTYVAGARKNVPRLFTYVGGARKKVARGFVYVGGVRKQFYPSTYALAGLSWNMTAADGGGWDLVGYVSTLGIGSVSGSVARGPFTLGSLFTGKVTNELKLTFYTNENPAVPPQGGQSTFTNMVITGFGTFPSATASYTFDVNNFHADWIWSTALKLVAGNNYPVSLT